MAKEETKKTTQVKENFSVSVDGQTLTASFKEFKTGSKGWFANGKVLIDGTRCQVNCIITIIGSKPTDQKKEKKKNG